MKKLKIKVNNKLKGSLGTMDPKTGKIEINVKSHKGDKKELASTIKHELMHAKHPKATEKEVYKKTAKTKIPAGEQKTLLAKIGRKDLHYKIGVLKRKYKMGNSAVKPGDFISKINSQKAERKASPKGSLKVAIMGSI